jgi:hypothetical protein
MSAAALISVLPAVPQWLWIVVFVVVNVAQAATSRVLFSMARSGATVGPFDLPGARPAAPLRPLPHSVNEPEKINHLEIRRQDRLGGTLHEYQHAA